MVKKKNLKKILVISETVNFFFVILQVGILDIDPSGDGHHPFLRGLICHHGIDFHYSTICSGNFLLILERCVLLFTSGEKKKTI